MKKEDDMPGLEAFMRDALEEAVGKRAATVADGTLAETLSSLDEIVGADGWKVSFYSIHNAASASARKNTKNTTSISLVFVFMALPS